MYDFNLYLMFLLFKSFLFIVCGRRANTKTIFLGLGVSEVRGLGLDVRIEVRCWGED